MNKRIRVNGVLYEKLKRIDFSTWAKELYDKFEDISDEIEDLDYEINSSPAPEVNGDRSLLNRYQEVCREISNLSDAALGICDDLEDLFK